MPDIPDDVFTEPENFSPDTLSNLGPLRRLAGVWQSDQGVDINPKAAGPERLLLSGEIGALQELAMHGLTTTERTAFVLRHLEDCTTEEIAIAMSIPTNTAKQSVFRAVQKLRRRLATLKVKT